MTTEAPATGAPASLRTVPVKPDETEPWPKSVGERATAQAVTTAVISDLMNDFCMVLCIWCDFRLGDLRNESKRSERPGCVIVKPSPPASYSQDAVVASP